MKINYKATANEAEGSDEDGVYKVYDIADIKI